MEGSTTVAAPASRAPAPPESLPPPSPRAPLLTDLPPGRIRQAVMSLGRTMATLAILALAVIAALVIWNVYVTAPWTRDGRIRVQVASVAPKVSGKITEVHIVDNQFGMAGLRFPLSTLRRRLHSRRRMTRGQGGSLLLSCVELSSTLPAEAAKGWGWPSWVSRAGLGVI
ncbi:MAG: hypothetical protein ACRYGP_09300 [Janthinobacterium lividum]